MAQLLVRWFGAVPVRLGGIDGGGDGDVEEAVQEIERALADGQLVCLYDDPGSTDPARPGTRAAVAVGLEPFLARTSVPGIAIALNRKIRGDASAIRRISVAVMIGGAD